MSILSESRLLLCTANYVPSRNLCCVQLPPEHSKGEDIDVYNGDVSLYYMLADPGQRKLVVVSWWDGYSSSVKKISLSFFCLG